MCFPELFQFRQMNDCSQPFQNDGEIETVEEVVSYLREKGIISLSLKKKLCTKTMLYERDALRKSLLAVLPKWMQKRYMVTTFFLGLYRFTRGSRNLLPSGFVLKN